MEIDDQGTFDLQEYIKKTLSTVEDMKARHLLKEIMNGVFLPLLEYTDSKYTNLENRVKKDFIGNPQPIKIYTGILERSKYEENAHHMYPMFEEDLSETNLDFKKIYKDWQEQGQSYVYQVFIEGDYLLLKDLISAERKFYGKIKTVYDEYNAVFELKINETYLNQVAELYAVFSRNGIEWRTVCAPYLYKIFDVYMCHTTCPEDEEIISLNIYFQEYENYVKYNYMPVWNIRRVREKTSMYPEPYIDKLNYKHIIYKHRLAADMEYIVGNMDVEILNITREDGDLSITCTESQPRKWILYGIDKREPEFLDKEVFHNGYSESSLLDNLVVKNKRIRTKGEIEHFINSMGYDEYVELVNIRQAEGEVIPETYCMDSFLEEEIRLPKNSHSLVLHFNPRKADNYFNYDVLSYLVTRVQWFYPEFNCIGVFGEPQSGEGGST